MNPAIVIIMLAGAVILWFLSAHIFRATGEVVKDVIDEARYQMCDYDEEEEK